MTEVASAQTLIIPSLSVSETYDSNVFYTPKSQLSGVTPEDFITTILPQVNVAHTNQFITGSLSAGAAIMRYLNNPDLDFTGYNGTGVLNLMGWAKKEVSQRITTLAVTGTYQYLPAVSGFGTVPYGSGVGTNFGSTQFGPFNAGLITNRVLTHMYGLGVTGGYLLTPLTTLTAGYNYSRVSFGDQSGGVNNALFDTTGHQGLATLSTRLTPEDTVGATAMVSIFSQDQSTGGGAGSFTTPMGTLNWTRTWTEEWTSTLGGGAVVILPQESATPGQSATTVSPTATASINYRSFSEALRAAGSTLGPSEGVASTPGPFANLPTLVGSLSPGGIMSPGQYNVSLVYSFNVFPSYVGGAGAIRAHVVGINATGGITSKLSGQVGMNYAHSGGSGSVGSYDTVGLTAGLRYLIGPVQASLIGNYLNFWSSFPNTAFSKEMVMLTLSTAFNSQSFFRMGGFGDWGMQSSGEGKSAPSGAEPGSGSSGAGPRN
jgi:hypothetical protein